ncbi:MAG TPA: CPBP family intramembrane glutamic endopeptidase [Fluviicoccus sp.]|nr:CPBP family intramembrane glutamic endopeptidase [Fluviicoccus sp.]
MSVSVETSTGFGRRFAGVWLVGVLGVLSMLLQDPALDPAALPPELRQLPPAALKALLLLNPLILLTVLAAAGAACAHRVGLASLLAGTRPAGRGTMGLARAAAAGLAVAVIIQAIDALAAPGLGAEWQAFRLKAASAPLWPGLPVGMLYGGVAEEVMMRWGVMSAVAWGLWRVSGQRQLPGGRAELTPAVAWTAIVVAALVFGAGHLPLLAQSMEPGPGLVLRTVGLNALAGIVYGWQFWRHGLESAMVAHASTHVGFALWRLAV